MPRAPLITVVGATGTGKSQLAVDIALRYNGEIINGDVLQLYSGLPIITNKIPEDEKQGIPHHLLGCIELDQPTWTVGNFVTSALKVIDEIRSRGRLPILVGGTHYYTQALLFHESLASNAGVDDEDAAIDSATKWPILDASTEDILSELARVDPVMANRWHPKDRRKIRRSLEIYLQTGRPASEIYAAQRTESSVTVSVDQELSIDHETDTAATSNSKLRTDTLVLWVHCDSATLPDRLNGRVDKMLTQGLLDEVRALSCYAAENPTLDKTSGIFIAIGYKEFLAYNDLLSKSTDTATSVTAGEEAKALTEAIERTKAATRQYSKRQTRWIRIKLLSALASSNVARNFFLLDGTDLAAYPCTVTATGLDLVFKFLAGETLPEPRSLGTAAEEVFGGDKDGSMLGRGIGDAIGMFEKQHCGICDMTAVTESDWRQHMASKRHKVLSRKKREADAKGLEDWHRA
ncbi:hypothetical protein MBLNU457_5936t1 [Dothideomycetes sp. NU457]